jgi:hypothetical protein
MGGNPNLRHEHELLKQQIQALAREHDALHSRPRDLAGHREHVRKLELVKTRIREHLVNLRQEHVREGTPVANSKSRGTYPPR